MSPCSDTYGEEAKLSLSRKKIIFYVMFKNRAAVFYRSIKNTRRNFRPDKTRAARLLNGFKSIPLKAFVLGVRTKIQIVRGRYISIQEKQAIPYQYSLYKEY